MQAAVGNIEVGDPLARISDDLWDDRIGFVKEIIGVTPTDQQGEALKALDEADNVTVRSGHGCGKSGVESWTVLHYMSCRPFPKIPCTAPSKHQLYDVLWSELSKWHRQMNGVYASLFQWTKERFFHRAYPEEWFAAARTATKENPEALQGFHADYVLVIIDEASGVPETIYEVADGAHGQVETKYLMCGNPTRLEGTFYRSHTKDAALYRRLIWNCLDSPIVPKAFIEKVTRKYGVESNVYRIRVLGEFPLQDGDTYIPYHLAQDALIREVVSQEHYKKVFGCDIARFGNDFTVIAVRQGDEFKPYHILKQKGTMEVSGYIARLARQEKPEAIFVDVIGLGAGVYDRLEELHLPFCEIIPVNVAELPAFDDVNFKRLRDELWGNMREWLEMRRGRLWDNEDEDLIGELTTPTYHLTSDGKIVIESKDEMRKRNVDSPNIADAHIMTFAQPIASELKALYVSGTDDEEIVYRNASIPQPFDAWAGY